MIFSHRTAWNLAEDDLTTSLRLAREQGSEILDLTVANPTVCDFTYPPEVLTPLATLSGAPYSPQPFGAALAREAVSDYYRDHGATASIEHLCLTTSTSEAYSFLFRLLCNPNDELLAARPSYPLFDFLARLDDVILRDYPLHYDTHTWSIDLYALEAAITSRTRAILLVHPNNPTGNFASRSERNALQELCARHSLALIVDEVFLDYSLRDQQSTFLSPHAPCLTFVLSGISKVCGLPQMKCSWIAACGPPTLVTAALERLEVIADTFLSLNTPVQAALPGWLAQRKTLQQQILDRITTNIAILDARISNTSSERLAFHGGWTTILHTPLEQSGEAFAHRALTAGVLVQPGDFYGLPPNRSVLSLLTPTPLWQAGLDQLRGATLI